MWKIFLTFVKVEAVLERVIFDLPCNILDQIYRRHHDEQDVA